MVIDNFGGTSSKFLNISYFDNFRRFITFFRSFYIRLQIVCTEQFMVKSVKIMYYAESGALWIIHISFINWL